MLGVILINQKKKSGEHPEKIWIDWVDFTGQILQGTLCITSQGADILKIFNIKNYQK